VASTEGGWKHEDKGHGQIPIRLRFASADATRSAII
jgi:hypothetical protein